MKTILFAILIYFTPVLVWANPTSIPPKVILSELVFDEHNNWIMELAFPDSSLHRMIYRVVIKAGGITSEFKFDIKTKSNYFLITSDSLTVPMPINPEGDKIIIESYSTYMKGFNSDSTIFGIFSGAVVGRPGLNCSICKCKFRAFDNTTYSTYLSKKPSLGFPNSLDGLESKLTGHIYDKNNNLVKKYMIFAAGDTYFEFQKPITLNGDGTYSTILYPTAFSPDSIIITKLPVRLDGFDSWFKTQEIEPLSLTYLGHDSILIRDIHLKSSEYVATGVRKDIQPKDMEITLINYPNPFNSATNFFLKLPDNIKDKSGDINIFNASGRLVRTIRAINGSVSHWNGKDINGNVLSSGIYYYQLKVSNNILKSGSMILLK